MRYRQIFFLFGILAFFCLSVTTVSAQMDKRCFTEKQCEKVRNDIDPSLGKGLYTGNDAKIACNGGTTPKTENGKLVSTKVGFCQPIGQAETKIGFGGKRTFANIGEFIQYMYKYGMWLAGILAIGLIVVSGAQWAASGGNSDMIGSAKNRITGAVTGLILLALSYTLLSTINPYLVQLRLPQAWLINEVGIAPPYCSDIVDKKVAYLGLVTEEITEAQKKEKLAEAQTKGYKIDPNAPYDKSNNGYLYAACGRNYLMEDTNGQTCLGRKCVSGEYCAKTNECSYGDLGVTFRINLYEAIKSQIPFIGFSTNQVEDDEWLDSKPKVVVFGICRKNNGDFCVGDDKEIIVKGGKVKGKNSEIGPVYHNSYFGIHEIKPSELCGTDGKLYNGLIFQHELQINNKSDKKIFFAVPASGSDVYFGNMKYVFEKVMAENSVAGIERIKQGLDIDAFFTTEIFDTVVKNEKLELSNFCDPAKLQKF